MIDIHRVYQFWFRRFRPGRMQMLFKTMELGPETSVIDIGGTVNFWRQALECGMPLPRVTIVNIRPSSTPLLPGMTWYCGDARDLPFADGSFDVAVSNSVIEHVGNLDDQRQFAAEAARVARRYFVQTPDRRFPVEPHFMAPFVHWLPRRIRPAAVRLTPWALLTKPTPQYLREIVAEIRLLGRAEMEKLFPEATVVSERFVGLSKSLIALR